MCTKNARSARLEMNTWVTSVFQTGAVFTLRQRNHNDPKIVKINTLNSLDKLPRINNNFDVGKRNSVREWNSKASGCNLWISLSAVLCFGNNDYSMTLHLSHIQGDSSVSVSQQVSTGYTVGTIVTYQLIAVMIIMNGKYTRRPLVRYASTKTSTQFYTLLKTILRDFGPYWHDSDTAHLAGECTSTRERLFLPIKNQIFRREITCPSECISYSSAGTFFFCWRNSKMLLLFHFSFTWPVAAECVVCNFVLLHPTTTTTITANCIFSDIWIKWPSFRLV